MSEEILKGKFEATGGNLQKILEWGSAPFEDRYDQMYLNLASDELRTIANAGESVVAYDTFTQPYIQEVELHDSVDSSAGLEAVLNVPNTSEYLNFIGGERVTVELYGQEGERGCTKMTLDGDLTASIYLPSSESDYESKATKVVQRYNDDNHWVTNEGEELETQFTTTVEQFQKIVEAKNFENLALSTYPVVIKDGEFRLDATDDNERDSISGTLWSESLEGSDVENYYTRGFEELFNTISGKIEVRTEQDSILSILRETNDSAMIARYIILPAN